MPSIRKILTTAVSQLKASQFASSTPELDAELMLAKALKKDRDYLLINSQEEVSVEDCKCFNSLLARRLLYEPVAYLLGYKEFWGMQFKVSPDVLIPRPDTELIVELAVNQANFLISDNHCQKLNILELGTGSGCIAISLAQELAAKGIDYHILATDKSFQSLKLAKENKHSLAATANISFYQSDWFMQIDLQKFDLIVSNPPYVSRGLKLQPELGFEPEEALYSEENGLKDIQQIILDSLSYLSDCGKLLIEFGFEQKRPLEDFISMHKLTTAFYDDLGELPRVVILSKSNMV